MNDRNGRWPRDIAAEGYMESQQRVVAPHSSNAIASAQSLSDAIANSLRSTVQTYAGRGPVPSAQWRQALRLVCQDARRSDVPIEQLLVALKQALAPLCDVFGVPHGQDRVAFTSHLVTICIEEFYRGSRP
jgi:hypothetical protein